MNVRLLLNNWLHAALSGLAIALPYFVPALHQLAIDHPKSVVGIAVSLGALHLIPDTASQAPK